MELPIDATTILGLSRSNKASSPGVIAPGLPWQQDYAAALGQEAYVWGFPWLYLTQICWLWTSEEGKKLAAEQNIKIPWAPMNSFFHSDALSNPKYQSGGSPNCDTLYSTAWIDLSKEPLILEVPEITDRFYNIEMACLDSDNFAYVGTRATGTEAGAYLIAGQSWAGPVPYNVSDILPRSRTPIAFLLGRTGVNSDADEEVAAAYDKSKQYRLTPLSRWLDPRLEPEDPPRAMVPANLDYDDPEGTWLTINAAMTQSPPGTYPAIAQTELINLFATIGVGPNQRLDAQTQATLTGLQAAATSGLTLLKAMSYDRGKPVNGWTYPPLDLGRAGERSDYITRAALQALGGIIANDPDEAVYLNCSTDSDGKPLSSAQSYLMSFAPPPAGHGFPPIVEGFHGFWSVTLYTPTYNLLEGSKDYTINSYDPRFSERTADGGMTIAISPTKPPLQKGWYWLQSPPPGSNTAGGADFFLILRVYVPGPTVSGSQTWPPPPINIWLP
jgi:hypothetical protein